MCRVTRMNESCHMQVVTWFLWVLLTGCCCSNSSHWRTYKWVMSHVWMNHVAHRACWYSWVLLRSCRCNNSHWHAYNWVMSHIWMNHVAYRSCWYSWVLLTSCRCVNRHWRTYKWVMPSVWMIHFRGCCRQANHILIVMVIVKHINKSCHTYEWVMSHIWTSHVAHRWCWYSWVLLTSCRCLSSHWHTYKWVMSRVWMSHVTHINESCHTWVTLIDIRGCCWQAAVIHTVSATHINKSCHTYKWVMLKIWMSHVTHINESCHTDEWVMSHTSHADWFTWVLLTGCCYTRSQCHTYRRVM